MLFRYDTSLPSATSVFNSMNENAMSFLDKSRRNINPIQVESQVPFWMIHNSDGYGNSSLMIPFLKFYYEWLSDRYGYETVNIFDVTKLFDISQTPPFLLPTHVNSFAPDIKGIFELPDDQKPSDSRIRNVITGIKTEIYECKSTENVYYRLMSSLFNIDPESITISYPGDSVLVLNGNTSQTILQDGNYWQPYTYLITSEIDDTNPYYSDVIHETLHPAGMRAFYEQVINVPGDGTGETGGDGTGETGGDGTETFDYEVPIVANYYPYTLGSFESLNKCTGCTGVLHKTNWDYPTFVFPTWDIEISQQDPQVFGDINVFDFFTLTSTIGNESPNDIIGTLCNYACGSSGSAGFNWYIGQDQQYSQNVYIENQPIEEPELSRNEDLSNKYN